MARNVADGPVVYVSAEDDRDELHRRLSSIAEAEGIDLERLTDLFIVPLAGQDAVIAEPDGKFGLIKPTRIFRGLESLVDRIKPRLVVLDTLADLFAGNENSRPEARQFIGLLRGLAIKNNLAIVLIAHPSLSGLNSGTGMSGSTAWNNSVRSRLYLQTDKGSGDQEVDANIRVLKVMKSNYAAAGDEFRLCWSNGSFHLENHSGGSGRLAASATADRVFFEILEQFEAEGRQVSPSPSSNYAPTIFSKHPDGKGLSKKAFSGAMDRLLKEGKICIEKFGSPSKQRCRLVIPRPPGIEF